MGQLNVWIIGWEMRSEEDKGEMVSCGSESNEISIKREKQSESLKKLKKKKD